MRFPSTRPSIRWAHLALLALILALVHPRAAEAQPQNDLRVSARFGFDGYYRDQAWAPLYVTLVNSGPDRLVQIRVATSTYAGSQLLFVRDVELASGTTRDLTLYILVEGYSSGVDVEIYEGGRLLETATASSTSITTSDLVYGVVAADPSAFGALAQVDPVSGSGYLAQIALEDLPDTAAAYGGLDVLVLSDVDTGTLSAAQLSAIEAWVSSGGRLWVTGGPGWQRT
ncbi:MAG TPA: hypothetical protein PK954_06040, partial [Anaerolineales bacterium]|nr:hypothetical protein [Anaerolineales bacterium]